MLDRKGIEQALADVGRLPDDAIDLAAAALALAALDRPRVPLDRYQAHLQELAAEVATLAAEDDAARAAALATVISERHGYAGDVLTYDDAQNANLMQVIDRRKGLPVALGILYLQTGRRQGWSMSGLNFPGHFLIRLDGERERIVLDPFHGGRPVGPGRLRELLRQTTGSQAELAADHYQAVGNRAILLRLQNNIKARALRANQKERAVEILRRMLLVAPEHAPSWRELGLLEAEQGNLQSAALAFEATRRHATDAGLQQEAALMLQRLRRQLN